MLKSTSFSLASFSEVMFPYASIILNQVGGFNLSIRKCGSTP